MEALKNYTDIDQSKKLAEILPIESADMFYNDGELRIGYAPLAKERDDYFPCWSLAALLNVIPQEIFCGDYVINITEGRINKWVLTYDHCVNRNHSNYGLSSCADTLVDACYEMIAKLHKQNLL